MECNVNKVKWLSKNVLYKNNMERWKENGKWSKMKKNNDKAADLIGELFGDCRTKWRKGGKGLFSHWSAFEKKIEPWWKKEKTGSK